MARQQVQIDVQRRVVVGTGQRIARGVHAHGLGQIVDGHHIAGSLAHAYGFAVLEHVDQLSDQDHHVLAGLVAERLAHGHHAPDIAVVVGAEHVDRHIGRVGGTVALVPVVGDVGGEIRELAVGLDDHAILVVTVLGGGEPGGALALVDVAALTQHLDGLGHLAIRIQAVLMEPHVEVHAEFLHGLADLVEHHRHGALAELLAHLGVLLAAGQALVVQAAVAVLQSGQVHAVGFGLGLHLGGDFVDIRAFVAVSGRFRGISPVCEIVGARPCGDQRLGEAVDLLPMIVEVVFAHHLGAVGLEHAGHGIAHGRPAGTSDVNRAGGVGGYELKIQRLPAQMVVATEPGPLLEHRIDDGGGGGGVKGDVDEAGAGDFHGLDARVPGELGCEQFSQVARFHAGLFGQLHGGVRRPVAMRAVLGAHHGEFGGGGNQVFGQLARGARGNQAVRNLGNQFT